MIPTMPGCQSAPPTTMIAAPWSSRPILHQRLGLGHFQRARLHRLALAVQPVERGSDRRRLVLVGDREQAGAERGVADAATRIDARSDQIAQVIGAGRPIGGGNVE